MSTSIVSPDRGGPGSLPRAEIRGRKRVIPRSGSSAARRRCARNIGRTRGARGERSGSSHPAAISRSARRRQNSRWKSVSTIPAISAPGHTYRDPPAGTRDSPTASRRPAAATPAASPRNPSRLPDPCLRCMGRALFGNVADDPYPRIRAVISRRISLFPAVESRHAVSVL